MNHRAKHRKEVKKYLRKKAAQNAKDVAEERDRKLFLFAEKPPQTPSEVSTAVKAATTPLGANAPLVCATTRRCTASTDDTLEDKPSGNSTAGGMSENASSDATELPRDASEWEFDFVFRTGDLKDGKDVADTHDNAYGSGAHAEAVVSTDFYTDSASVSLAPVVCCVPTMAVTDDDDETDPRLGQCIQCINIPDATSVLTSQHKITSTLHVKYLESVPALPMARPLAPGTNLNAPTQNYLTVDSEHNLHQFSPGFERDRAVAMRSIFASAVKEWNDHPPKDDTVIVSTGDAIRSIFQQAYAHDKPMGLYIRRVGPTLIVESRASEETDVDELRAQSLLGKALYRIREGDKATSSKMDSVDGTSTGKPTSHPSETDLLDRQVVAEKPPCGVVALPSVRVGSALVPARLSSVNRFSQTLLWEIDNLEVLVGVDAPIVVDNETRSRSMVKIEDEAVEESPTAQQRDVLNCWFDATLANVPQVDVYVHKDGVVQRHELKKVNDMLGIVDGRIATAAMSFTSNVLQWMVQNCTTDGATYAVVRFYDSDYLELYELPHGAAAGQALVDPMGEAFEGERHTPHPSPRSSPGAAQEPMERSTLTLNFARMCLAMGRDLLGRGGGRQRAEYVCRLLTRALFIFVKHADKLDVQRDLGELAHLMPDLARQLVGPCGPLVRRPGLSTLRTCTPQGDGEPAVMGPGPAPFPDAQATSDKLRGVLIACSRFEARIQQAIRERCAARRREVALLGSHHDADYEDEQVMALVPLLIPCSAALSVIVARALALFNGERTGCTKLKRALSHLISQAGGRRGKHKVAIEALDAQLSAACNAAKEFLQVAVEGLLRLEHLSEVTDRYCCREPAVNDTCYPTDTQKDEAPPKETGATSAVRAFTRSLPTLNCCSLARALAELYGDVVLLCMSDSTSLTVDALHEIAKRIATREESRHTPHSTTLTWLRALTADRLSLSFTALRFYSKAGSHFKRRIKKVAQVHYYVGCKHLFDSHYAKALEVLQRSLALFEAGETAPCDEALGECFLGVGSVDAFAVERALGDTHSRMAAQEVRVQIQGIAQVVGECPSSRHTTPAAPALPHSTQWQPLAIGSARPIGKAEERECTKAMEAYSRAGWAPDRARILIHYVAARVSAANVAGEPLSKEASVELWQWLDEADRLDHGMLQELREMQLMRVFTATAIGQAANTLVRQVNDVVAAWTSTTRSGPHLDRAPSEQSSGGDDGSVSSESTLPPAQVKGQCECGPLVVGKTVCAFFQGTVLEEERGLGVAAVVLPAAEKEAQLALVGLVMATTVLAKSGSADATSEERARQQRKALGYWVHQCLGHVLAVLGLTENSDEASESLTALRLRVAAVCWGSTSVRWWLLRMVHKVLVRLTPVVRVLVTSRTPLLDVEGPLAGIDSDSAASPTSAICGEAHLHMLTWVKTVSALV